MRCAMCAIAAAVAGGDYSLGLAADGTVFSWGLNHKGQLGLGQRGEDEALPQKVVGKAPG
jgi:alpha-tubulin suppressor-like RCC1 family protein